MATKKEATRKTPAAPQAETPAPREAAPAARPEKASPKADAKAQPRDAGRETLENKGSSPNTTSRRPAEEIARRAYELWQKRGAPHGSDQEDWHAAERELNGGSRH